MYVQTGSGLNGLSRARYEDNNGIVLPTPTANTMPLFKPPVVPSFEVSDSSFVPAPINPTIPADRRPTTTSLPVASADYKLAFELAEAKKWGYTHSAWMAMGSSARMVIRAKYPEGYKPVTQSGVSITAAQIDLIEGRDPLRSKENYTGAGDSAGGIEFREPLPSVPLISTQSGVAFDDIVKIDPVNFQTTADAAGVTTDKEYAAPDYVRYGLMALAGWVMWDAFLKPKKAKKRRRSKPFRRQHPYPYESHKRYMRQGWQ